MLSNKKIKYIKRNITKKTPEKIAKDLKISTRDVQKVLRQLERKSPKDKTITHVVKKDSDATYKYHLIALLAICLLSIIVYSNIISALFFSTTSLILHRTTICV